MFLVRDTPRPIPNALPLGISLTAEHILTAFRAYPRRVRNAAKGEFEKVRYWVDAKGRKRRKKREERGLLAPC